MWGQFPNLDNFLVEDVHPYTQQWWTGIVVIVHKYDVHVSHCPVYNKLSMISPFLGKMFWKIGLITKSISVNLTFVF